MHRIYLKIFCSDSSQMFFAKSRLLRSGFRYVGPKQKMPSVVLVILVVVAAAAVVVVRYAVIN